jgi:hypothetical protein
MSFPLDAMNMKKTLIKISILIFGLPAIVNCQQDSIYGFVASKNGLVLRESSSIESKQIGVCEFASKVKVLSVHQLDTIEFREANWLEIINSDLKRGFVFGGFINSEELPENEELSGFYSISEILSFLSKKYEPQIVSQYKRNVGQKSQLVVLYSNSTKMSIYDKSGWEWGETEFILKGWKIHELANLISLCSWFGINHEYQNFKNGKNEFEYSFQYNTAHSDPEIEIYLEQGENGVRIVVKSNL